MSIQPRNTSSDVESAADDVEMNLTMTPCEICGPSTINEEMVGCDGCEKWFHSRCVGGVDVPKSAKWYCKSAVCQQLAQENKKQLKEVTKKQSKSRKNTDDSEKPLVDSAKGAFSMEQKLKALKEKQKQMEDELEAKIKLKQMEKRMMLAMEKRRIEMERKLQAEDEEEQRVMREEVIREKHERIKRMETGQLAFDKQVADLDRKLIELRAIPGTSSSNVMHKQSEIDKVALPEENEVGQDSDEFDNSDRDDNRSEILSGLHNDAMIIQKRIDPTKAQLAARKGLAYKLPTFSGKPAEWPLFYAAYKASNETCGFMDHENLVRLQEFLTGDALNLVSGQLLLPQSVPRVIEKLRMHYGRPEQLLKSLLDKVRKLEAPKSDKLASFIPFGNAVEQLCEHLEASGLSQHLVNPLLIQDLVDKLPDPDKREWVRYKRHERATYR